MLFCVVFQEVQKSSLQVNGMAPYTNLTIYITPSTTWGNGNTTVKTLRTPEAGRYTVYTITSPRAGVLETTGTGT